MNTPDNKRRQESQAKIMKAFVQQLQYKELAQISVTEICKDANVNRSTFYANYLDIYDLADQFAQEMINSFFAMCADEIEEWYQYRDHNLTRYNFTRILKSIKENPMFYEAFIKLNVDITDLFRKNFGDIPSDDIIFDEYSQEFIQAGMNAVIKRWLLGGCVESPVQISRVLQKFFQGNTNQ